MTVRVYRSTDAGAPALTGTAGSLVALLDAVLVNGYGALPPAGWSKPFGATNKAVYRNNTVTGTGRYLRVRDDLTGSNARYALTTGYDAMTAVDTGTGAFPSTTDTLMGIQKSNTADSVSRPWVVVADEFRFYLFYQYGGDGTNWECLFFGDIISYKASDAYRTAIAARYTGSSILGGSDASQTFWAYHNNVGAASGGAVWINRIHDGTGGAHRCGLHSDGTKMSTSPSVGVFGGSSWTLLAYPNAVNSGLLIAPIFVHQTTSSPYIVRGYLPGLWAPLHNRPIGNQDTFSGVGPLAGKSFEAFNTTGGGQLVVETSDTWG